MPPTVAIASSKDHDTGVPAVAQGCASAGFDVLLTPPLYHMPEDHAIWSELAGLPGPLVVLSDLHPRPAKWVLARHDLNSAAVPTLDLRTFDTPQAALSAVVAAAPGEWRATAPGHIRDLSWTVSDRWYPVIDASRCVNCQHCLQFCLFGVYELDEAERVRVNTPDNCKPGCPACARICPAGAIMFPLYATDQAIAGAPGQYTQLDEEARRMFYMRAGVPCPVCSAGGEELSDGDAAATCPECSKSLPPRAASPPPPQTADEIDSLIAELEDIARGGD